MFSLSVPPTAEVISPVRHMVRDWLSGATYGGDRADDVVADDVVVVISELVTNGVIHDGGADIELYLFRDRTGVTIEVVSADQPTAVDVGRFRPATGPDETGRGLLVVDALTDVLSIDERQGRRHVVCHVPVQL
jgi:anti-sigma regulatory factor (Ser/Thr protein kinase)